MHFIELCDALGYPHPAAEEQSGEAYTFEKGVTTTTGGQGFADVWMRSHFAWEYKSKDRDLKAAYQQLLKYREDLENPPLLVVCDLTRFEVHTNFTDTAKKIYRFSLDDLLKDRAITDCSLPPLDVLRALFTDPTQLRPDRTAAEVTELAAAEFATLADSLRNRGNDPERAAHFLMRLLFCLFAEDTGLLPPKLFSMLLQRTRTRPTDFRARLAGLFAALATGGAFIGPRKRDNGAVRKESRDPGTLAGPESRTCRKVWCWRGDWLSARRARMSQSEVAPIAARKARHSGCLPLRSDTFDENIPP